MPAFDAVLVLSMLTIIGSVAMLVALGMSARRKILHDADHDRSNSGGGDGHV